MRRSIVAGALFAAGLALTTLTPITPMTPAGAVPTGTGPKGAAVTEFGHGVAHAPFSFPVGAGKHTAARQHYLQPGEVVDWGSEPGSFIAIVSNGTLTNYPACSAQETWSAGGVYYTTRSEADGTLAGVTRNEGDVPAMLAIISSEALGAAPAAGGHGAHSAGPVSAMEASAGCPTGSPGQITESGNGIVASGDAAFDQEAGKQMAVYRFVLEPGYTSDWHQHPDANFVIQDKGVLENWRSCKDKEVWDPGYTYFHAPGYNGGHQNLTNNKSDQPAELIAVFFNLPANYPAQIPAVFKAPPPADCASAALTY